MKDSGLEGFGELCFSIHKVQWKYEVWPQFLEEDMCSSSKGYMVFFLMELLHLEKILRC